MRQLSIMKNNKIDIKRNHVPYLGEKVKLFNRSKKKLLKIIKRLKVNNQVNDNIKKDLILKLKSVGEIDYKLALEFIMIFSLDYMRVKDRIMNKELDPEKIKTDIFWINPSKDLVIFFVYTLLYEMYNDHLIPHLDYLEKCNANEIELELNKY